MVDQLTGSNAPVSLLHLCSRAPSHSPAMPSPCYTVPQPPSRGSFGSLPDYDEGETVRFQDGGGVAAGHEAGRELTALIG